MPNTVPAAATGLPNAQFIPIALSLPPDLDGGIRAALARIREQAEAEIEQLIALLDVLDWYCEGDPDAEAVNEDGGDILDEPHDERDEGNAEPWLGSLGCVGSLRGGDYGTAAIVDGHLVWVVDGPNPWSQAYWSHGGTDDAEQQCEDDGVPNDELEYDFRDSPVPADTGDMFIGGGRS